MQSSCTQYISLTSLLHDPVVVSPLHGVASSTSIIKFLCLFVCQIDLLLHTVIYSRTSHNDHSCTKLVPPSLPSLEPNDLTLIQCCEYRITVMQDLAFKGVLKVSYDRGYAMQTKSLLVESTTTASEVVEQLFDALGLRGSPTDYALEERNIMTGGI